MFDDEPGAPTDQFVREAPFGDRVLLVIDGAALQVIPLPGIGTLTIGRASKCNVVIDSGSVSRHHANLILGLDVEVEDAGSSNGTFVGGVRKERGVRTPIDVGVPFSLGAVTLMVQTRAASRQELAPTPSQLAALEDAAARIAAGKLSVLVTGEQGVGKEWFAERIHALSPRRAAPFVRVNCAAISESSLDADLFGTETPPKPGLLEHADGGSVFLANVDQLPTALQAKLLRTIEDATIRRAGKTRGIDVRFLAASTRELATEVEAQLFRRDLFFLLAGAEFALPPLRERRDDILPLAEHFVASAVGAQGRSFALSDEARQWLLDYDWPGNIRELRNACERAVLLATGSVIERHHIAPVGDVAPQLRVRSSPTIPPSPQATTILFEPPVTAADMPSQVRATVAELEKQRILEALDRCAGNQTRAAELLGISRRTLINRLDEYAIARPRKREE